MITLRAQPGRMAHRWSGGICWDCGTIGSFEVAAAHYGPDVDAVPREGRVWLLFLRDPRGDLDVLGEVPPMDGLALWLAAGGYARTAADLRREAGELRLAVRAGLSHDEYSQQEVADLLDYRADRIEAGHG